MMKKLLVLMLVLGMSSLASAVMIDGIVEWEVVGDQLIGTGTEVAPYAALFSMADYSDPGALIVPNGATTGRNSQGGIKAGINAEGGNKGKVQSFAGVAWEVTADQLVEDGVPQSQFPGVWFVFDIVGEGDIVLSNTDWAPAGTIHVPEPLSLGLLGLGGLFLRRRK